MDVGSGSVIAWLWKYFRSQKAGMFFQFEASMLRAERRETPAMLVIKGISMERTTWCRSHTPASLPPFPNCLTLHIPSWNTASIHYNKIMRLPRISELCENKPAVPHSEHRQKQRIKVALAGRIPSPAPRQNLSAHVLSTSCITSRKATHKPHRLAWLSRIIKRFKIRITSTKQSNFVFSTLKKSYTWTVKLQNTFPDAPPIKLNRISYILKPHSRCIIISLLLLSQISLPTISVKNTKTPLSSNSSPTRFSQSKSGYPYVPTKLVRWWIPFHLYSTLLDICIAATIERLLTRHFDHGPSSTMYQHGMYGDSKKRQSGE